MSVIFKCWKCCDIVCGSKWLTQDQLSMGNYSLASHFSLNTFQTSYHSSQIRASGSYLHSQHFLTILNLGSPHSSYSGLLFLENTNLFPVSKDKSFFLEFLAIHFTAYKHHDLQEPSLIRPRSSHLYVSTISLSYFPASTGLSIFVFVLPPTKT